jgi:dipeptidyl aminopeptidase/acylaminoacyl peptidase
MKSRFFFALLLASGLCHVADVQAVEPRELLEVVDFSPPVLSPDGKMVAFRTEQASVERNTYDAFWYVQKVDGTSLPHRVADVGVVLRDTAGVSLPVTPVWSPDGRWIYYRASVDGKIDVWRAAVDGSGAVPLTHDPADVRDFRLADGGRTLQYSVGATREEVRSAEWAEYYKGIHIDSAVPIGQPLFHSGNIEGHLATQRYGKLWFDRVPLLADVPDRWKAVALATGVRRESVSPPGAEEPVAGAKSADAKDVSWKHVRSSDGWVAMLTRVGEQRGLLQKPDVILSARDLRSGMAVTCSAPLCTGKQITGIQWRPESSEVLFTVTDPREGGAQSIYRWNVKSNVVRLVVHSRGLVNGGRSNSSPCGVSSTVLVCVTADAGQPPRLERIDLGSGRRQVLFDPNAALARTMARSTPVRLLRWKGTNGQVFTGQFYPAQGAAGSEAPLFVSYYQCTGFVRGGVGDEDPFASLATHGISALCINEAPYVRNPVDRYNSAIAAVAGVVRWLSASGEIDCAKVGMGGLSFGSEVTTWVAMKSRLLAAASVSTPSMSSTYYLLGSIKGTLFTDGLKRLWGLGAPEKTPGRWRLLSPQFNLDKISAPILLQMPEQEYLAALDYAIPLINRKMADLYVFPDEPHQKFQPRHKLAVYERNLDWFRFWLQGYEDPAPLKRAQYARWRAMRKSVKRTRSSAPYACKGMASS